MSEADSEEAPPRSATVYVQNLNEDIKLDELVPALRELFENCGTIIDIIAKKSVKRKGQAFIVYDSPEAAQTAIDELKEFDLFGKTMRLSFARTRSDATVLREDGEEALEAHKAKRLAVKERKQAEEAAKAKSAAKKRAAAEALVERPAKAKKPTPAAGVVPEEYLPPNKILLLRDVPEDYGKEGLQVIFSRFPGFNEVRTVPTRKTIAFVEYNDEAGAIAAKEATDGMMLGDKAIKVTYQRQ